MVVVPSLGFCRWDLAETWLFFLNGVVAAILIIVIKFTECRRIRPLEAKLFVPRVDEGMNHVGLRQILLQQCFRHIDTGKVVDCEAMARYYNVCKSNERLKTTDPRAYATWQPTERS